MFTSANKNNSFNISGNTILSLKKSISLAISNLDQVRKMVSSYKVTVRCKDSAVLDVEERLAEVKLFFSFCSYVSQPRGRWR